MKIRCDVCDQAEASVFCSADEAALCHGCDLHVHRANKLAGKHSRFSLLQPIKIDSPLCDICQERRALVFCQQDRAILCRECDISIHGTNEHTQKHNRFLLTGVKLSSTSFSYQTSSSSNGYNAAMDVKTRSSHACSKSPKMAAHETSSSPSAEKAAPSTSNYKVEDGQASDGGSFSTSSISEYLETLPGWCVEEFLDPSTAAANRFCKFNGEILAIGNQNLERQQESLGIERFGNTLEFVGKFSQTGFWNGVGISMKTCRGEKMAVADKIISNFGSENNSGKIKKQTETNFLFVAAELHILPYSHSLDCHFIC
ncbi:B-box zinc finger protein 20-like isoform X1 [Cucurbita pepo subsp. pepo]|uniref:B-box zinc finger protein 20-like isoform X1 n=1 Tax=Cucurbita pepo subsp. pepo TaxID=3664 RepID=UPI000C9D38A4|nr:B-box zinc finger protein 20-like isoform X1 [Cucurbita pepo subsp. pepo]